MRSTHPLPSGNPTTTSDAAPSASTRTLQAGKDAVGGAESRPRRLRSGDLLGPGQVLEIVHGDAVYRLRVTALGKLILTK
ncbi:hemin uptake protein HemP [Rubrivivax albus]|uniref:Hemin uptake protein HemP n=1 Tax=Rubrivivax albus TaxID=2499835 RepID=A0A3S2U4T2_9BURK|nr:hemin uptake protein HemP [Rubrivivax albus]